MKILATNVLKGPNYWSNYRQKLIAIKLDIGEYEEKPSNLLPNFPENLASLLPSLATHRCSRGIAGGFLQRLKEGTWIGHIIEHIALELQTLANMDCGFGRTYGTKDIGVYHVIFSYEIEQAGLFAGNAAIAIAEHLGQNKPYPYLAQDLQTLRHIALQHQLGPSTQAIVSEAQTRDIPYRRENNGSLITLGHGQNQQKIWASLTSNTSSIAVDIAADKALTKQLLAQHFIPVPQGVLISSLEELDEVRKNLAFPWVIKPYNGNHGRGISINIQTPEKALSSFFLAQAVSNQVIVESYIPGIDFRFLVINFEVVAVAKRIPAHIIGDGKSTIKQLIDKTNNDPRRGHDHDNYLTLISIDEVTLAILAEKNLQLHAVLPLGETLYLKDTANLSTGGTAIDITQQVHPANLALAKRAAQIIGLDVCGIDIIAQDMTQPYTEQQTAIVEVNAGPGLRMHLAPTHGLAQNVAKPLIDMLYPAPKVASIPIVAITGTNGKTTVARLVAHLMQAEHQVGLTTTDGIYFNNQLLYEGDCSGPQSAQAVLYHPEVSLAVLECARGGILRSGLGFKQCDVSIITNITADHLGLQDIETLEDLAEVKAVVARSTRKEGYALLNADDDRVYALKNTLHCQVGLFGLNDSPRLKAHRDTGGLCAFLENSFIVVYQQSQKSIIADARELPATFDGQALCMIKNLLPAILTATIFNMSAATIHQTLQAFIPSPNTMPGRLNLFDFNDVRVLLDYAHNAGAYAEIQHFLAQHDYKYKTGIISATGDRRDEDTKKLGYYAATMFDTIIIRHNEDKRGNCNDRLTRLLQEGIAEAGTQPQVWVISEETAAIEHALNQAKPNTFIFYSVDSVPVALNFVQKKHQEYIAHNTNKRNYMYDSQRQTSYYWRR